MLVDENARLPFPDRYFVYCSSVIGRVTLPESTMAVKTAHEGHIH